MGRGENVDKEKYATILPSGGYSRYILQLVDKSFKVHFSLLIYIEAKHYSSQKNHKGIIIIKYITKSLSLLDLQRKTTPKNFYMI